MAGYEASPHAPPHPAGTRFATLTIKVAVDRARLATLAIKVAVRRLHVSSANANKNLTSHIPNQQAGW